MPKAAHVVARLQDDAGAEEADACDDLGRDAAGVGHEAAGVGAGGHFGRDDGEHGRAHGHQQVGAQAGGPAVLVAFEAHGGAQQGGHADLDEDVGQFRGRHGRFLSVGLSPGAGADDTSAGGARQGTKPRHDLGTGWGEC
jgi:hypothetical protein